MAVVISGNGIDMGNNPVSNASQIDGVVINENNENVATTSNLVGFKNYIINGNFDIWQRGDSFSPISDSFFTADRWRLDWAGVATGLSASKQPGLVGKNSLYVQRTGGAKMQIYQLVENQGNLSNKTFTFSALVRSSFNGTINFRVADGRSGTNFIYEQTPITLEANIPKKIVFTVQLGQVSADALAVAIATTCTNLYIDAVQMEEGSVATPFEQRPIGLELSLCERYYEVVRFGESFPNLANVTAGSTYTRYREIKRVTPVGIFLGVNYSNCTNARLTSINNDFFVITIDTNASATNGCSLTATLSIDAEL